MDAKAAQDLEKQVVQQQPQLEGQNAPGGSAGGGPTMSTSTPSDAPPDYSEMVPAKSVISVHLPGQVDQPQLMYQQPPPYETVAQSVQNKPYMVPGVPRNTNEKYRASHDFVTISAITSILCGMCNILSLTCAIPAIILAFHSLEARERANYRAANRYSNCALGLTLAAIINGLVLLCVVLGIILGLIFQECSFYTSMPLEECRR